MRSAGLWLLGLKVYVALSGLFAIYSLHFMLLWLNQIFHFFLFEDWTQSGISDDSVKQLVPQLFQNWYVCWKTKDGWIHLNFYYKDHFFFCRLLPSKKKWDIVTVFTSQKLEIHKWLFLSMVCSNGKVCFIQLGICFLWFNPQIIYWQKKKMVPFLL